MGLRVKLARIRWPKLPTPDDGLRAIVDRAPQAQAALERMGASCRPAADLVYKLRRRLATGAVALLTIWLLLHVMFSANGMVAYKEKRGEIEALRNEVDALQQENDSYTQQIKALKSDPKAIEKEAREQLHYARPGEVVYVSPPALPAPAKPVINSAKKK
jgi:cell division protein FtsB